MRKRRLRRCLAVSTVIGNMLMILITLSLAAILVAWAGTSFGAFSGGSQLFFVQRGQALQERFVIEAVFFNNTSPSGTHQIMFFARNVGVVQTAIVSIYVTCPTCTPATSQFTPASNIVTPCTGNSDGSVTLVVGYGNSNNVCEFRMTIGSSNWTSGTVFTVVIASGRGNQATATARGP